MSVIKYKRKKYLRLARVCKNNPEIVEVFKSLPHYIHYSRGWLEGLSVMQYIDRMFWFLYVANRTAYNVQYQDNAPINYETKLPLPIGELSYEELEEELSSIDYNTFTNSGGYFIDEGYIDSLHLLRNFLCKEYKVHHTKELTRIRKKWNLTTKFKIN
tara:strand:+ start:728 stop:1201 length:474 start_codon:yes stop_codon:yes gene_type:complete